MTENSKHCLDPASESFEKPSKIAKTEDYFDEEETEEEKQLNQIRDMNMNPRVQRYLVAIEYIGTRFSGSQQQPNFRTVVGVLEDAFRKFIGQPVSIFCSSRTDAGVHALSNVCHVDVERVSKRKPGEILPPHEPAVVRRAVNHFLQKSEGDISVVDLRSVPNDFHSRYKAQERTYFYRLLCGPEPLSVFERDRAWHVPQELDLQAMQDACKVLVGRHDFSSFRASGCQANSPTRSLDELNVSEVPQTPYFPSIMERGLNYSNREAPQASNDETHVEFGIRKRHRCYVVTARARSFLYHQVRLLVGVLKCAGAREITVPDVEKILEAKTVTAAKPMAPSYGLYLGHVKYDLT